MKRRRAHFVLSKPSFRSRNRISLLQFCHVIDNDNEFCNDNRHYKLWAAPHISVAAARNLLSGQ